MGSRSVSRGVSLVLGHGGSVLLTIYYRSSPMGVIHSGRVGYILARTIGAGLGDVILKVLCILDFKVE